MKNIVEVLQLNDNRIHICELPVDLDEEIKPGRVIGVEYRVAGATALAVVQIASRLVDAAEEALIREYSHNTEDFQKVRFIYPEPTRLTWPNEVEDAMERVVEAVESDTQ